eukprot:5792642-Alexandrium_andersonii.AAC.1
MPSGEGLSTGTGPQARALHFWQLFFAGSSLANGQGLRGLRGLQSGGLRTGAREFATLDALNPRIRWRIRNLRDKWRIIHRSGASEINFAAGLAPAQFQ